MLFLVPTACQAVNTGATPPDVSTPEAPSITETPPDSEPGQIRFGSPRGAAAMAITEWQYQPSPGGPFGGIPFTLDLVGSPDPLVAQLASGDLDAALLPVNVAATVYNRTNGAVQLAAITAQGLLYAITDNPNINSFADLNGHTVTAFGLGATPQFVIEYFLAHDGISADIEYTSEAPEAVAKVIAGQTEVAILPEPFVTAALLQADDFRIAFSLNDEWVAATGSPLVTTALVFRTDWALAHPDTANMVIERLRESVTWVNDNPELAAQVLADYEILPSVAIAQAAIPRANLVTMTGAAAKTAALEFLTVLYDANPESIGGSIPGAGFFFE